MMTHCRLADKQTLGNLFVPQPFADKSDDFALSRGERGDLGRLGTCLLAFIFACYLAEHGCYHRAFEPHLTHVYFFNSPEKNLGAFLLQHQTCCTEAHGLTMQVRVVYACQDEDTC